MQNYKKDLTNGRRRTIIGASNSVVFALTLHWRGRADYCYKRLDQTAYNWSHFFAQRGRFRIDFALARTRRFSQMIMILIWAVIMILICAVIMILIR